MKRRRFTLWQKLAHLLEAMAVIPLGALVSCLPWNAARRLGCLAGTLAFHFNRKDKGWAYDNLDVIYADRPPSLEEKRRIARKLFINLAVGAVEFAKLKDIGASNHEDFIHVENRDALNRALEKGKGVLAVTAHMGNWEILGKMVAETGADVGVVLKHQHNPYTDRWIRGLREKHGKVKGFYNDPSVLVRIGRHLKRNGILALLADQRDVAVPMVIPFFGKPCSATDGPARLHLWFGSPIVLCFSIKQEDGKYLLYGDGPHHFEASGDAERDCLRIMSWIYRRYEEVVRKHPDQWLSLLTPRWEGCPPEVPKEIQIQPMKDTP